MYTNLEAIKAGNALIRATKGAHVRRRAIWGLSASTVLDLHRILVNDPENESKQIRSIINQQLYFRRKVMRKDLRLYAAKHDAIHEIIAGAVNESSNNAGEVFKWLRHMVKDQDFNFCSNVLELVSRWENPSKYMSVSFRNVVAEGILEVIYDESVPLDRVIEVLNENSEGYPGHIDVPNGSIGDLVRVPPVMQEGVL